MLIPLIAFIALLIQVTPAASQETQTITVLTNKNIDGSDRMMPFNKETTEFFQYLEKETNVRFEFKRHPWRQALFLAKNGHGFLYGASITKKRLLYFKFSHPIYFDYVWIVKRCDTKVDYDKPEDLAGKTIGVKREASYGEELDSVLNDRVTLAYEMNDFAISLKDLLKKREDGHLVYSESKADALMDMLNHQYADLASLETGSMRTKPFCVVPKPATVISNHFAVAPGYNDAYLEKINAALIKAKASGELARIFLKSSPR
ncbi:substrate-binding periplasmic protein [Sapientia aquatica]|uniref:Transporter substrate-binding domain-containing protein n=1 Tax=Sapientia aquatica TaxID=1549640 RepID=A0A4R5VZ35_9BURK|nr:transporter substrate-binding domain-containing protein [Sapientia aquatica]TDK64411.1 transporter substrate-binding domain-containing protein [Sapientia aquatica]